MKFDPHHHHHHHQQHNNNHHHHNQPHASETHNLRCVSPTDLCGHDYSADHTASDFLFRVVVLGDAGSGKSSLVQCFTGVHPSAYGESAGLYCRPLVLPSTDIRVNLQIKDLSPVDRLQSPRTYLHHCTGVVLCYDSTDRESFHSVVKHYARVRRWLWQSSAVITLVGCKSDQTGVGGPVATCEAVKLAAQYGMRHTDTSAVDHRNVDLTFRQLSLDIFARLLAGRLRLDTDFRGIQLTATVRRLTHHPTLFRIYVALAKLFRLTPVSKWAHDGDDDDGDGDEDCEHGLGLLVDSGESLKRSVIKRKRQVGNLFAPSRRVRHLTGAPQYAPGWSAERIQAENYTINKNREG